MPLEDKLRSELRDYAWKYFALHADQRLKTFNFFVILATVVVGGLLAFLKDSKLPWLALPGGLLLVLLSYVFWRMDRRNRELIHHAEEILKAVEQDVPADQVPAGLRLFTREDEKTEAIRGESGRFGWNPLTWFRGHYSYADCFGIVFVSIGLAGLVIGVAAFFVPPAQPAPQPATQQFFIGTQPATPAPPK